MSTNDLEKELRKQETMLLILCVSNTNLSRNGN